MSITALYAAVLALVLVVLSVRTLRLRRKLKVAIGHGNQPLLERAMRVHANFCEYVPIALLLVYFLEAANVNPYWIHALGIGLLVGRLLHAFGVSKASENYRYRIIGMALTFTVIISSSLGILLAYVRTFGA